MFIYILIKSRYNIIIGV